MGGCCGKSNHLDHGQESEWYSEQEYNNENTNISRKGYNRADTETQGADVFYNDDCTSRNITHIDETRSDSINSICNTLRLDFHPIHKDAQIQVGRGPPQAEMVVDRTSSKKNREESNRKKVEKSSIPSPTSGTEKIIQNIQETRNISPEYFDIKVNRKPLKEITEEENKREQEKSSNLLHIKVNKKIVQDILETISNIPPKIQTDRVYSLETVEPYSEKGSFVMSKLTNRKFREMYKIKKIKHINNPYLLAQYELSKARKKMSEQILYHGTRMEHLDSICTYNFDWRMVKNCKYGFGVSFANNPYYASHYSTRGHCADEDYVMILAKVLIGRKCRGKPNLTCPKEGFDTTTNYDEQVLVKFDDGTFYPEFIIFFEEK